MAILDSPESFDTTSFSADNDGDHRSTLRRRPSARAAEVVLDSNSNSLEADAAVNGAESDRNDGNSTGNLCGRVVESVNEEQRSESAGEGLSYVKEKEEEKGKENGEIGDGKGGEALAVKFAYRPSAPAHRKIKESPLSSDAIFKQARLSRYYAHSHAGLFNLCIVVLVAVNGRLIIENLMKYGWLIKAGFWFSSTSLRDWPLLMCCLSLPVFPLAAFLVEKLVQQKYISEWVAVFLHVIITTTEILYPVVVILRLNILAELLCFGDREFYKDWWNARTVEEVPLVIVTNFLQDKFKNSMVGNMMFWCFFCILGQPMSVLLYYHDLMNRKASASSQVLVSCKGRWECNFVSKLPLKEVIERQQLGGALPSEQSIIAHWSSSMALKMYQDSSNSLKSSGLNAT
ncbi:UNVERIFIED_CONTAM: Diacylglycerol O-acyltransferase 1 [Sesamum radiatum]|uniref:diacylglycerol O-acyltransferase n=1 Tax=Sesamum radiatum TaxID=300843 RepID=A0AAW2R322_SESRA